MFGLICNRWLIRGCGIFRSNRRFLNNSQTAAALRPFYFAVHPDLFGRYPKERSVNEQSLKILHEYVASLQTNQPSHIQPTELVFYMRSPDKQKALKDVRIVLKSADIRKTVTTILEACGLSLDFINTISKSQPGPQPGYILDWHPTYHTATAINKERRYSPPPERTLQHWLQENSDRIHRYKEASQGAQDEIDRLCHNIVSRVGVKSVRWENIWGNRHYIASLLSFNQLCDYQPDWMRETLAGRHLVFSNGTGINLHGEIVLGSEDVPNDWVTLLRSVSAYDPMIQRLPRMEGELSTLLHNIRIVRRQQQEFVMAQTYEVLLNKMLNSLSRSQLLVQNILSNQDLSHLVMVVECESGPLALSNKGQFLIPASIPASIMLQFVHENKDRAETFLIDAEMHMFYLEQVLDLCHDKLDVSVIIKDDAVTPQQMTECCQRLLDNHAQLNEYLHGTRLKVSTYYTILRDGEVTIPWNWISNS